MSEWVETGEPQRGRRRISACI